MSNERKKEREMCTQLNRIAHVVDIKHTNCVKEWNSSINNIAVGIETSMHCTNDTICTSVNRLWGIYKQCIIELCCNIMEEVQSAKWFCDFQKEIDFIFYAPIQTATLRILLFFCMDQKKTSLLFCISILSFTRILIINSRFQSSIIP